MEVWGAIANLLIKQPQIVCFVLGALLLFLMALNGDINTEFLAIPINNEHDILLRNIAVPLIVLGMVLSIVNFLKPTNDNEKSKSISDTDYNAETIREQGKEIENLKRTISEANRLVEGSDDYVSRSVRSILSNTDQILENLGEDRGKRFSLLFEWIDKNKKGWVDQLPIAIYKKEISRANRPEFRDSILRYIDFLKSNILDGAFYDPSKSSLTFHQNNRLLYKNALSVLEKVVIKDLNSVPADVLDSDTRSTFLRYFHQLIEDMG